LFNEIFTKKIDIKFSSILNNDEDLNVDIRTKGLYLNEDVKSMILDVFDFDLTKFKSVIDDYNIMDDLLKPLDNKPWLVRDRVKDTILF
jgi:hypothetical protein